MRPDGDPEHDDYGLPHVDVVVPDDARDLDRDVIAYHRERRRLRRRARIDRLVRPFARFGVAIPIITGALLIALVSGVLMTSLGTRPEPRPTRAALAPHPSAPVGRKGGFLPDGVVTVPPSSKTKPLSDLRPGVVAVVPPKCSCAALVADLAKRTRELNAGLWLVADRRGSTASPTETIKSLRALAGSAHDGDPIVLDDAKGVLAGHYATSPDGRPATGLTAVFVGNDGVVSEIRTSPQPGPELSTLIAATTGQGT
ncbi:hypothetical protein DZF91_06120 [Actinomadura logoneensis]|uniref:Uncharacterized protein n=1 Tax=Actinomadura logoneensis TaxID=2293572 RepID=A0A372JR95_9ACTN|nr:hypothetical protein [Actinomadura logoneensis]RFU42542.1 hypothetical protein DZF91_06120 [Actinomadura logoneensis]